MVTLGILFWENIEEVDVDIVVPLNAIEIGKRFRMVLDLNLLS